MRQNRVILCVSTLESTLNNVLLYVILNKNNELSLEALRYACTCKYNSVLRTPTHEPCHPHWYIYTYSAREGENRVLTTLYFCIQNVQLYYIAYLLGIYAEYTEHLVNPL